MQVRVRALRRSQTQPLRDAPQRQRRLPPQTRPDDQLLRVVLAVLSRLLLRPAQTPQFFGEDQFGFRLRAGLPIKVKGVRP